jgi:hypothetical protein
MNNELIEEVLYIFLGGILYYLNVEVKIRSWEVLFYNFFILGLMI